MYGGNWQIQPDDDPKIKKAEYELIKKSVERTTAAEGGGVG
jgi:hypothetical protein